MKTATKAQHRCHWKSAAIATLVWADATAHAQNNTEPVRIAGPEQAQLDFSKPDGGLPPAFGVQNIEIFRACRSNPQLSDGLGWTYHHHMDIAAWKGRLWVAWVATPRHEDQGPQRLWFSTSADGFAWSAPQDFFPAGIAAALRMYFFLAPNGRMLALAGSTAAEATIPEADPLPLTVTNQALVVREISADGRLGPVFTVQPSGQPKAGQPPPYLGSDDPGFIQACRQLLADHAFLRQQDNGTLLEPADRTKWNDSNDWTGKGGRKPSTRGSGKALSFFTRKDGTLVGVAKHGFVTVSPDRGETWSKPAKTSSLVSGMGKIWGQQLSDSRYALVYNPHTQLRYPLVMVQSDDGTTFDGMRVVHGGEPRRRYDGVSKNIGANYHRGLSKWNHDGSWKDDAMWLVYSLNKEDIWVARVPPQSQATGWVKDDFSDDAPNGNVAGWNIYSPLWAPVRVTESPAGQGKFLSLEDRDPFDHARAVRLFPETRKLRVSFEVQAQGGSEGKLEVTLLSALGGKSAVRLSVSLDGNMDTKLGDDGIRRLLRQPQPFIPSTRPADHVSEPVAWQKVVIEADCDRQAFTVSVNNGHARSAGFQEPVVSLSRLSFQTLNGVDVGRAYTEETDLPIAPIRYGLRRVEITAIE